MTRGQLECICMGGSTLVEGRVGLEEGEQRDQVGTEIVICRTIMALLLTTDVAELDPKIVYCGLV